MKKSELHFEYPENLIAKEPQRPSRICSALNDGGQELTWLDFFNLFQTGDVLVVNDTKVLKRRVFSETGLEILFLKSEGGQQRWEVLFPSKRIKIGQSIDLPGSISMVLVEKGRPQKVETSRPLDEAYFETYGELPLPPYIQKVRSDRHTIGEDSQWYQTAWNQKPGSFAAPTASLHFNESHLEALRQKGVTIVTLTLHVGLGTFLPVDADDLENHKMHSEEVSIPFTLLETLQRAREEGGRIWAMGTTVIRALESQAKGLLQKRGEAYTGGTELLILPGFEFKMADRLLTNFHQPESTLLALVMAFAGKEKVRSVYSWAIEKQFRLFSYGDLSIWKRE